MIDRLVIVSSDNNPENNIRIIAVGFYDCDAL